MKKHLLLFMLFFSCYAFAQNNITVSGTVTESATGEPVIGAAVVVKGTSQGISTDIDGNYTLQNVPQSGVLQITYLGMKPVEVAVNGNTKINVAMDEDTQMIDEVVVVGYGSMKVKDLTSAITTVRAEEVMKTPAGQVMQGLQGKVAGLQVISSGNPGEQPTIRVRGDGSFRDSSPLYVVDGIFYNNISFLNNSDIASVSILKDASAAAIYGVRAANGVVLIETKSGGFDKKTEIEFDGYYGVQRAQNVLKMANAEQFVQMAMESGSAADISFIDNAMQRFGRSRVNPNIPDVNTDWYKEILRLAPIQNYSLNVSGGSSKASYSVGTNYFEQDGILDMKNQYSRFNLRSKVDIKATDWLTVGGNAIWSQGTRYEAPGSAWTEAYFAVPILPVYDELNTVATPKNYSNAKYLGYRGSQNPFPTMETRDFRRLNNRLMANFYASLDFIPKKLNLKTTYSHVYESAERRDVEFPYDLGLGSIREKSAVTKRFTNYSDVSWDNVLTYTDSFGDHGLTAMLGSSYRKETESWLNAKGYDFQYQYEESWYLDQSKEVPSVEGGSKTVNDGGRKQYAMSYFGRLSYNFKSRYLLYATMRADGTSKYQEKWGYFPTIGAGWVISEESFMNSIDAINYLKLRASWGQLGNDKIAASDGALTTRTVQAAFNDMMMPGTTVSRTFSWLGWERTEETNIGFTSRFLNNRLGLEVDYYIRDTKNAVISVSIPAAGGSVMKDVGSIRNSGFEMALDWSDFITKDLSYNIGVNFSTQKNEVTDLYGQPYLDGGSAEFRQRSIVGEPIEAFYGREVIGVYQTQQEIDSDPAAVKNGLVPGDFKYKDINGDGEIDDNDRTVLGSRLPTFMYGGNIGLSYKNIDFSLNFYGQTGNKILNRKRGEYIWTNDTNMDADLAINRWHGAGTSNKYPSSSGLRRGWNQKMSDYFVEDGSFFRIQNIQIGYSIVNQRMFGVDMPNMRVFVTADRPLTIFSYNGFNPEISSGIDNQAYPVPATYTVGLNIKF